MKMVTQTLNNFDEFFLTHTDMAFVMIQYNKMVSNEVKDKYVNQSQVTGWGDGG